MYEEMEQDKELTLKIATILEEIRGSLASHTRKLKELSNLRSSFPKKFFTCFCKSLSPLFLFHRRTVSAERVVRFVSVFSSFKTPSAALNHTFLDDFLKFLLSAVNSANKTARFRSCQIISEVLMRLPDDAEVNDELWDQVIDSMMIRAGDKIPIVRTFAIRALSRFVNDSDNSDILELFIEVLESEQNADVRKTIILALPPTNATAAVVTGCTLDVSESVRKSAYLVLADKFPLQSLSIKLRTLILQRGLSDRSASIVKECLKLLKDEWLSKSCNGDPVELLKYLDVETYECVGVSVMRALLEARMIKLDGTQRIQQFKDSSCCEVGDSENSNPRFELLEPEIALYWRVVCQYLHSQAQAKGSDAAATMGAEAEVYAAEASDSNDLLEKVMPPTVSDYVEFVLAHISAGSHYRFTSRQLLLLGALLDFSDVTIRKIASKFVQDLLQKLPVYETDGDGNKLVIGDGMNLGGERDWADAVAELAKKVHAADGEFEEVTLRVVEDLARPCRERIAGFIEWSHCLAVVGFVLENTKSMYCLRGKAIEPSELLNSVLLPGAKHVNMDVQRAATQCLGLYGLLARKPGEDLIKQLVLSFAKGTSPTSLFAGKALIDLVMWHGPQEVDTAIGQDFYSQADFIELLGDKFGGVDVGILDLLYAGLESEFFEKATDVDGNESGVAALGEGFAKILLSSENYPSLPGFLHSLILAKLISLYFRTENNELQRLKQCLSVFFEHYSSLSANHKKHLSEAFIPVMQEMWPGIDGTSVGSPTMISNMRKCAVRASRFMLQMVQSALYQTEVVGDANDPPENDKFSSRASFDDFECSEEGLALRIAAEIARFPSKKKPAEKSYISALCKTMVLLQFRVSEQGPIKLMRLLLNHIVESVSYERELVKEIASMAKNLKSLDVNPEEELSRDQAKHILERLGVDYDVDREHSTEIPPTPASRASQPACSRRRAKREESSSDEEQSPASVVPTVIMSSTRSQRASKTAAMTKMTASKAAGVAYVDSIEEEGDSDLTSEDESDDSDSITH